MRGYLLLLPVPLAAIGLSGGSGDDDEDGGDDPAPDARFIRDGSIGADTQSGGPFSDLLFGRDGDERLNGANGEDLLMGEAGDDTLFGAANGDLLFGGPGNDALIGGSGEGEDHLFGNDGNDSLRGDFGDDILTGDGGSDTLDGGVGDDLLVGLEPGPGLAAALGFTPEVLGDLRAGLEARYGSLIGDGQIDRVIEGLGMGNAVAGVSDQIIGAAGSDTLIGDAGDVLAGGQGEDAFGVCVADLGDDSVTLADYDADLEGIEIVLAQGVAVSPVTAVAQGAGSALVMGSADLVLPPSVTAANVDLSRVSVRSA